MPNFYDGFSESSMIRKHSPIQTWEAPFLIILEVTETLFTEVSRFMIETKN